MNFQNRCKKLISEAEEKVQEINGENNKNIIVEKDPEKPETETDELFAELDNQDSDSEIEVDNDSSLENETEDSEEDIEVDSEEETQEEKPAQQGPALEEGELDFLNKFIEFTELTCLFKSYNEIFKGFNDILGSNSKLVKQVLDEHKEQNKQRLAELKEELKTKRAEIEEAEKINQENAKRKLSLVSLLDKAVKKEKEKLEK